MVNEVSLLLVLAAVQILAVFLPDTFLERHCRGFRRFVTGLAGGQALVALCLVVAQLTLAGSRAPLVMRDALSFQFAGTSSLMFLLISFIGWVTCRYSIRYLDGESRQGRYFKWLSLTIGAVGGMALSADLLTFALFWSLTSFGLHHLLVHYGDRPAAQRAAWTKFTVSRIGDVAVVIAICLYYPLVKSLQFADLAAAATDPTVASLPAFQLATLCLVLGVMAKSAQIPFHSWLPLTMETPTPVSALMHAGIVNAGGYLLVRLGPLLGAVPAAQLLLVVVATLTACVASVVMLTQTSIKRKLAYSTISQMGFMLMQCALGAYSAAMLHIIAHSLYKAHEFLSSGSVMTRRAATQTTVPQRRSVAWPAMLATMVALVAIAWSLLIAVGQDPLQKPGGWLLTGLLCAALTSWMAQVLAIGQPRLVIRAAGLSIVLLATYALSFALVDWLMPATLAAPAPSYLVVGFVLVAFTGLFLFQLALTSHSTHRYLRQWQIHAANGFYIESSLRRSFRSLMS